MINPGSWTTIQRHLVAVCLVKNWSEKRVIILWPATYHFKTVLWPPKERTDGPAAVDRAAAIEMGLMAAASGGYVPLLQVLRWQPGRISKLISLCWSYYMHIWWRPGRSRPPRSTVGAAAAAMPVQTKLGEEKLSPTETMSVCPVRSMLLLQIGTIAVGK